MVVLVSPRLAVMEQMRVLSMTWNASLRARAASPWLLTTNDSTAPPTPPCCAIASSCCGCDFKPGKNTRSTPGCFSSQVASFIAPSLCAPMRIDSVSRPLSTTHALNGDKLMPALRITGTNFSLTSFSLPQTAPAITRPCPSRYLVPEWTMKSAPYSAGLCRAGEQKQLSTASHAPADFAISDNARMSQISVSGFVGDSANSSFVLGLIAPLQALTSVCETKLVSTPNFPNSRPSSMMVEPNTLCEQTTWSPAFSKPIASNRIALMPLDVAIQASVPSIAARRRSIIITVGLVKRE